MATNRKNPRPRNRHFVQLGATCGLALALAYSLLFMLYVITRSSISIADAVASGDHLTGTLVASSASTLWHACRFAAALSLVAAVVGIVTVLVIYRLLWLTGSIRRGRKAAWVGLAGALAVAASVQFLVYLYLDFSIASVPFQTYLFWLGAPALLHVVAGGVGGWYLAQTRQRRLRIIRRIKHVMRPVPPLATGQ